MDLEEYNSKRDFTKTPEPKGLPDEFSESRRFVVQRHDARNLHFDLRLEMDGVLKSWAIPKGPSMNANDKRLAIRTEDHPINYLTFNGIIPKGNYGAGQMTLWDTGYFEVDRSELDVQVSEQLEQGNLKLIFYGEILQGHFGLIRTGDRNGKESWLLFKKKDEYATSLVYNAEAVLPQSTAQEGLQIRPGRVIAPMLASTGDAVFNDPDWIYELKWDGYRVLAHIFEGNVMLQSRNGVNFNDKFPILVQELENLGSEAVLDGEVVLLNSEGMPQFGELQNYPESRGTLCYYVFDMLFLNGHSMLNLPLVDRKSLIPVLLEGFDSCRYCDHIEVLGTALYDKAVKAGLEGIMAKLGASEYSPGIRTENWLKIKSVQHMEATICGYTDAVNGGLDFGSLILGVPVEGQLKYIGNCGSGISAGERQQMLTSFQPYKNDINPFGKKLALKGRHPNWLQPVLQCEVAYSEFTRNGYLRNPVFKNMIQIMSPTDKSTLKTMAVHNVAHKETVQIDGHSVPVSNLEKIFWPSSGYTKYDLIDYYLSMADFILPHLTDRPQNLHRHPDGIRSEGFYQKEVEHLPEWIKTVNIYSKSADKEIKYLLCQDTATLIYMANLGCIEINPWSSTIMRQDLPDYGVIDLDPPEGMAFELVVQVALTFKEVMQETGITGYCKTSGSKGLHIYVPFSGAYSYEEVRNFIKLLCHLVMERLPEITTMERQINKREGKLYLDHLQNRKGHTVVAAYSARPRAGATISTPLQWEEIGKGLAIADFTIKNVPDRVRDKGDIFSAVLSESVDMSDVLNRLESYGEN